MHWLAVLALLHTKKVHGLNSLALWDHLCGVCMFSLWQLWFSPVHRETPTVQRRVRLTGDSKLAVDVCWSCSRLATCPECT